MKKIAYFAPEMEVIDVKMSGMLCASQSGETPDFGGQGDPDDPGDDPAWCRIIELSYNMVGAGINAVRPPLSAQGDSPRVR